MAIAGSGNETPWGWIADNVFTTVGADGVVCFQGMRVVLDGVPEDSPLARDAKAIVQGIDPETLDTAEAEAELRAGYEAATDTAGNPAPVPVTDAQVKHDAVHQVLSARLFAELEALGYDEKTGLEITLESGRTECR